MNDPTQFGVVILAAGASQRMGQPKMLMDWFGHTILAELVASWTKLGTQQIAVVNSHQAIREELLRMNNAKVNSIINPQPEQGMFSSIKAAANWSGWHLTITHFVISLGDQPHLQTKTLADLLFFAARNPLSIAQPVMRGKARHPVVLPKAIFRSLAQTNSATLKEFLNEHEKMRLKLPSIDPGLELDIDTPEDYQRIKKRTLL